MFGDALPYLPSPLGHEEVTLALEARQTVGEAKRRQVFKNGFSYGAGESTPVRIVPCGEKPPGAFDDCQSLSFRDGRECRGYIYQLLNLLLLRATGAQRFDFFRCPGPVDRRP